MNYRNLKVVIYLQFSLVLSSLNLLGSTNAAFLTRESVSNNGARLISENTAEVFANPPVEIACPPAYIGSCGQSSSPSQTGWPIADGNNISPDYLCYHAAYSDNNLNDCGNGVEIVRTWTITNTCGDPLTQCTQVIKLSDDQAPELTCPSDSEYPCDQLGPEYATQPEVNDACGSDYTSHYTDSPHLNCTGSGYTITRTWYVTDACGNASSCSFVISVVCRPSVQANHITFSEVSTNSITVHWFNGNGNRRIVVMNTSNNFTQPVDGYDPEPNTDYPGGGKVLFNGDDDLITVSGLSPNTTYWFRVFEASDCSGSNYYLTSTAVGNPKSQSTLNGQIPSWMGIYLSDLNHNLGPTLLLESSSIQIPLPNSVKICADGSNVTLVKFKNTNTAIPLASIRFRIQGDPSGQDTDQFGKFENYTTNGDTVIARYRHPKYVNPTFLNILSYDDIEVVSGSNPVIYRYPIRIYRAPVVFVHGLWGNKGTFEKMQIAFMQAGLYPLYASGINFSESPLLERIDYTSTNGSSFSTNRGQVKFGIREVLKHARSEKFSAGKVIVVGHSMGGILGRLYLQGSWPDVPYKNDIIKLITLNTPHYGAQTANWLWDYHYNLINNLQAFFNSAIGLYINNGDNQAINDLRVNSDVIKDKLNIPPVAQNKVASVTIHSDAEPLIPVYSQVARAVNALIPDYIFNGDINDLIVPKKSQRCGINIYNTLSRQWHVGSAENVGIINACKTLLDENPSVSPLFTNNGFPDDYLLPPPNINSQIIEQSRNINDSIFITYPVQDQIFNAGDTITLNLSTSVSISRVGIIVYGASIDPITFDTSNISTIQVTIPNTAIGIITILALGGDSINWTSNFTLDIKINSTLLLDSIVVIPSEINSPLGIYNSLATIGYYLGTPINLTGSPDLSVAFDSTIVHYADNGLLQGVGLGTTSIVYSYKGLNDTSSITVFDDPSILVSAFNYSKSEVCENTLINFTESSIGLAASFKWVFPGGTPSSSTEPNPTILYDTAGVFSVGLTINFVNGIDSLFLDSLIIVNPLPTSSISTDDPISFCQGDSAMLSANESSQYLWSQGEISQNIIVRTGGQYSLTVTDENGCSASSEPVAITVHSNPTPTIIPGGQITLCEGEVISLISDNADYYQWSTSDTTQSILVSSPGGYFVQVVDSNGCSGASLAVMVNVIDSIFPLIQPSEPTSICSGDTASISSNEWSSYTWNTGDTTKSILVFTSGEYFVVVTDTNGCSGISSPLTITVYDLPIVDLGPDTLVMSPYHLDAGNTGSIYTWNTGETTQTIMADSTGLYSVTITDAQGCQSMDAIFVEILTSIISLNETKQVKIYPNPNNGSFTLSGEFPVLEMLEIKVIDPVGHTIFSSDPETVSGRFNKTIDLGSPAEGMYYLNLSVGDSSYSAKVIIHRY